MIGAGRPIESPGLPCVAVPTTAGTGSEVTRNSVLSGGGVKASLRSPLMLPKVAVVDPDLLLGLPSATIAASGMDALSPADRATPLPARQPLQRCLGEGRDRSVRSIIAPGVPGRHGGCGRTRRPGARQSVWGACAWPTPGWARSMALPPPRAPGWRRHMVRSAPLYSHRLWTSTCRCCVSELPNIRRYRGWPR